MALKPIKVSQLNKYIGRVMQTDPILGNVSVIGEISNISYNTSGHVFFSLKDDKSKVNCFIHASLAESLRFQLTDGMEVIAAGYISVYEKGGYHTFNIRDISVSGEGSLALAYKAMYEQLMQEGLFDSIHKKPIPPFPRNICIVTSPTGAAVRDIIKIIKAKNNLVNILLYPCTVQGDGAAAQIAAAIDDINLKFKDTDIIIAGRGGGSLEELWAFNEEIVARSIYKSKIPIISAVGHETDFSISDYVADARAETPTAAAAMAVPDISKLKNILNDNNRRIVSRLKNIRNVNKESVKRYSPEFLSIMLSHRVTNASHNLKRQDDLLKISIKRRIEMSKTAVRGFYNILEAGSPERIVSRGYAIIKDSVSGHIISNAKKLKQGQNITIFLQDSEADGVISEVRKYGKGKKD